MACGDPDLAEELAQEAFARALNHWDRVAPLERPAGWLYRTGFNLLRTHWKKSKRREPAPTQPPALDSGGDRIDLMNILLVLPEQQRHAVVLRHVLDYSTDEAAEVLGVSAGALRMTLHRAVDTLRKNTNLVLADEDDVQ